MRLTVLTGLVFQANMAIDEGYNPSVQEIVDKMGSGELVNYLQNEYPDEFDFSETWYDDDELDEINEAVKDFAGVQLADDEYQISNNGLCYAVAILTELIQQEEN